MKLNVLLVDDDHEDMEQFARVLPEIFNRNGIEVNLDAIDNFEEGVAAATNGIKRYDLVLSDTYRGEIKHKDAAVMSTINEYRKGHFCPLIIFSSGEKPVELSTSVFLKWVDKTREEELETAITELLELGIPQVSNKLHSEIDNAAGKFLWGFLEKNWKKIGEEREVSNELIERIVRRRAAMTLSDLMPGKYSAIEDRYGLEYYIYPALEHNYYNLGDIVMDKNNDEIRVILTPHCYLFVQPGQNKPRAEYVLTVKTVLVADVLGTKLENTKGKDLQDKHKKLKNWLKSPADTERKPEGRHWYLPKFLKIPHLYCDFLQVESLEYTKLNKEYKTIATLLPPYAEALQECFSSFYGSVGIPRLNPDSVIDLIDQ